MPKFKLLGRVVKESEAGVETLASGSCIKEAESAEALRIAWEHDMRNAFPMGPDYNVDYHCVIEPITAEPIGVADVYATLAQSRERQVGKSRLLAAGYGSQPFRPSLHDLPRATKFAICRTLALAVVIGILVGAAAMGWGR